ncbi:BTAD domain-containing putative transcriptional regulator [Streptomyces sp. NPDC058001]|uniref:BTAD domain-containing putative transcriptional regulator n=1 Tax=Streptomyces sp. NPDC058001 TaxID=3346300 RepID=UPI0036E6C258
MNATDDDTAVFRALGPVQVWRGGAPLDLGPPQRRVLLLRLLIEEGRPVTVADLSQCLWKDNPPTGAISSVRAHVSRLRSVLDPERQGPSTVLFAESSGYSLRVPREARDTTVFEDTVHSARTAVRHGRLAQARRELDQALGLWRGKAFQDAAEEDFAVRERNRLNAILQEARELQATTLLRQGDLAQAISAAEGLIVSSPLREVSWALLMRALYAGGRPTEALQQYERFRVMLDEELGLDPSPGLKRLQTAILRHDTGVLDGLSPFSTDVVLRTGPGDAPPPLAGRSEETSQLMAVLSRAAPGRTACAVVSGEPGVGKTRLLDELAARAVSAGFAVARAQGGQAQGGSGGRSLPSPAAQLLHALRQDGYEPGVPVSGRTTTGKLLQALSRRPTLCIVDDLDEASPEVQSELRHIVEALPEGPIAVVCAMRAADDPTSSGLLTAFARRGATWLRLDPLTLADVTEVLTGSGEHVTPAHAAALHRRSAGNPFILTELLKLAPDRRTGAAARVPTAVRSAILSRLAGLPEPVRVMLTYGAVDAEWLDIALLADILDEPLRELLPLVDMAVAARLLVWEAEPSEHATSGYRLPELPREVILSTLAPSSRQLLHAALAKHLAMRDDTIPARLARHLRGAGAMATAIGPLSEPN